MKKIMLFLLLGFLVISGTDVHALEREQLYDLIQTNGVAEEILAPLNLTLRNDGSFKTCIDLDNAPICTEDDFGFYLTLEDQEHKTYSIYIIYADDYVRFKNDAEDNAKISSTMKNAAIEIVRETIAREQGTTCKDLTFTADLNLNYEEDGMSIELEEDGSTIKSYKMNHKTGFAGAIEKAKVGPIKKDDEEEKEDSGESKDNQEKPKETEDPKDFSSQNPETDGDLIVNPATGDLNMPVVAILSLVAITGIGISIRKVIN